MSTGQYQKWLEPENLTLLRGWKMKGLTDEQIARNIGIAARTLERWKVSYSQIRHALKIGKEQANYAIENKLFEKAQKGNITAMIFWLKNNYREKYTDSTLTSEERLANVQRTRKLKAEADIAEARAARFDKDQSSEEVILAKIMDALEVGNLNDEEVES
ncbi:small terminase subunit [Weissella thailandensis]|uniref:Small terminase subunit n=1 Tax=Weissella thailandensis TaxID=89061 RepID=A0ABX9I6S5_9LACO|nr:small terminase subunit [Weissella thailandensis]NKY90138.1 small terminase subunit [Weissella thailandensis]RDS60217.1 small terminase subunit [Weissella thailandensis]GEP74128.1 hypothetical protein WTH01_03750 [Weissella thailandensis]